MASLLVDNNSSKQTPPPKKKIKKAKLKTPPESCSICCEPYTKKTRTKIVCGYCDLAACKVCQKTYMLSTAEDPHCMGCKKKFTKEFIFNNMGKSFLNGTYKNHHKQVLYDIEKSKMPATQPDCEQFLKREKVTKEIRDIDDKICHLKAQINKLYDERYQKSNRLRYQSYGEKKEKQEPRVFIKACPVDKCKGFLDAKTWKCGICETYTCSKCFEVIGKDKKQEHVCDENTLKTAQLMKKETKPCPSCGVPIFKISGCDQMWCTVCHIAFSWQTGRQVTGTIHNPHYYAWAKDNNTAVNPPGAQMCGGLPDWRAFFANITLLSNNLLYNSKLRKNIARKYDYDVNSLESAFDENFIRIFHRSISHNQHVTLADLRRKCQNVEDSNKHHRMMYMLDRIDEKTFKKNIEAKYKAHQKTRDILDIMEFYQTSCIEILNAIYQRTNLETLIRMLTKWERIRLYCNDQLTKLRKIYNNKIILINSNGMPDTAFIEPSAKRVFNGLRWIANITEEQALDNLFTAQVSVGLQN